jgi:hypothetical protein
MDTLNHPSKTFIIAAFLSEYIAALDTVGPAAEFILAAISIPPAVGVV